MKEEIIYPELPPGYVYRKPGECYPHREKYNQGGSDDNDIDILLDGGVPYGEALRAFVTSNDRGVGSASSRGENTITWKTQVDLSDVMSVNDALSTLVARLWLGVWK